MSTEATRHPVSISSLSRRRFLVLSGGAALGTALTLRAGSGVVGAQTTADPETGVFLDAGTVHEIAFTFDQSAYEAMVATYAESGDKEWLEATVTIDGASYEQVGIRLKGNSSLMGLRMSGPEGMDAPDVEVSQAGDGETIRRGPGGEISADKPEGLPWLVRLDRNIDGQNHHGLSEFVIRANNSKTSLNEAVALDLLAEAGLASQRAASSAFSVNSGTRALRLAIENPDDTWMAEHFAANGLLYKSEATGDWSYRGDDPDSYNDIFDLEAGGTGDDSEDFAPLAAFLDFVNNSDDATFAAELPDRVDLDSFAVYLAMMDLIENFDDIDGPGNNSYLYTNPDAAQFTVVPWDMNLAFRSMGGGGGGSFGFRTDGPEPPDGTAGVFPAPPMDGTPTATDGDEKPANRVVVRGGPGTGAGPDGRMREPTNPLVERAKAVADFATLLSETSTRLRADLYDSGSAAAILARRVAVLTGGASDLVDAATITSEAEAIAAFFTGS